MKNCAAPRRTLPLPAPFQLLSRHAASALRSGRAPSRAWHGHSDSQASKQARPRGPRGATAESGMPTSRRFLTGPASTSWSRPPSAEGQQEPRGASQGRSRGGGLSRGAGGGAGGSAGASRALGVAGAHAESGQRLHVPAASLPGDGGGGAGQGLVTGRRVAVARLTVLFWLVPPSPPRPLLLSPSHQGRGEFRVPLPGPGR